MSQLFQEKGVRVETRLPDRVSPVDADLDRLIQVLLNLLSNAVKFCPEGKGRVEVGLTEADGACASTSATMAPASSPGPGDHLREVPPGGRHAHGEAARHRARTAHQPPDRRALRRPDVGGKRAGRGRVLLVHAARAPAAARAA